MNVKEILEQQKKFQGKGALKDKPDKRDYKAEEILAGVTIARPSFAEGYSVIKKVWPNMPYTDQKQQFSCTGRAVALYKQILQKKDTGEETIAPFNFEPYKEEAAFYKNRLVASISTQDFEKLADLLFINDGFVSGWGNHAVYFAEYGILNGKRFLKTPNSYGEGNDLYYFEGMEPLFSAWTAIDLKIVQQDSDALYADLKYGDKGTQVLKLKKALKRLGWTTDDESNEYNGNLADLVMRYKLANVCAGIWERAWERFFYKGKTVDQRTRENINFNLLKR